MGAAARAEAQGEGFHQPAADCRQRAGFFDVRNRVRKQKARKHRARW